MPNQKPKTNQRPGKYKVTLKIFDENDRCVYLRLPPKASWFVCTGAGSVDAATADQMFDHCRKADLPPDARPVFTMPEKANG